MINVKIDPTEYKVEIDGHAGYAPHGSDIVCSAVSILYFALVHTLEDKKEMLIDGVFLSRTGDKVSVKAMPYEGYVSVIEAVYDTFTTGIRLLTENYPDHVSLENVGVCAPKRKNRS